MIFGFDGSRAFGDKKTGTENYSFQLLKALAKVDRNNKYIIYLRPESVILTLPSAGEGSLANASIPGTSPEILRFAQNDKSVGITREDWPKNFQFKTINWPRFWTQGGLALQTFKDKLDVLFVPSHTLPLIRKPGLRTVVTVHDLGSEFLPQMHQLKQRLYLSLMQKFQLQTATKIIAVSKATKKDLINRIGIEESKIEVVYEGYDKEKFKSQNSKVKNDSLINTLRYYDIEKDSYFLFVGTVQPRKNLERVIEAFAVIARSKATKQSSSGKSQNQIATPRKGGARNDDVSLIIAGSKGWLSDEIYKLPKKLGIEDRVKFLGYVPDEDLPALYSGAVAFLYPSLFEGFGLPILEAQACGCPVITSNVSSMPEVAGPPAGGGAILVDPYNVEDIVKGMVESQKSKVKSQKIKEGLENVKRFSWEKCARETLAVLEETFKL